VLAGNFGSIGDWETARAVNASGMNVTSGYGCTAEGTQRWDASGRVRVEEMRSVRELDEFAKRTWKRARGVMGPSNVTNVLNREEVTMFYERALEEAGEIANQSTSKGFEDGRRKTWWEFSEFMQRMGKQAADATGLDVVVFIHEISVDSQFLEAAGRLIRSCEEYGDPIGQGFLLRPLNERRNGFKKEAMSSGTLRRRIQQRLKDASLFEGETLHSFRRSAVQHAAEIEGYDVEKLMKRGRWSSYAAFRLYIEEIEHRFPRRRRIGH
ncbi:hypothetical protein KFL_007300010, partial [Klebsormidium nitens]